MLRYARHAVMALFAVSVISGICQASTIRPAQPTHLFYTPTAYLNNPYDLVVSLHEISYTLPYDLQFHISLVDNIGRNCLGVRYALSDRMQLGAGLAHSITTFGDGGHGIKEWAESRFGFFFCYGFARSSELEAAVTPHMQLGDHFSLGVDLGFMKNVNEVFSFIGEIGSSFDMTDEEAYLNLIPGIRIHHPKAPFLSFDIGVDFTESPVRDFGSNINPYLDIIFAIQTN